MLELESFEMPETPDMLAWDSSRSSHDAQEQAEAVDALECLLG